MKKLNNIVLQIHLGQNKVLMYLSYSIVKRVLFFYTYLYLVGMYAMQGISKIDLETAGKLFIIINIFFDCNLV